MTTVALSLKRNDLYNLLAEAFRAGIRSTDNEYNGSTRQPNDDVDCLDNFEAWLEAEQAEISDFLWPTAGSVRSVWKMDQSDQGG